MQWDENKALSVANLQDLEDRIATADTNVVTGKQSIFNAIVNRGKLPLSQNFTDLVNAILSIVLGSGNAQPADVLAGKTFTNSGGVEQAGTMPNNAGFRSVGAGVDGLTTAGRIYMKPPLGYYDGNDDLVYADDPDFAGASFLDTKNVFGLQGLIPTKADYTNASGLSIYGGTLYTMVPVGYHTGGRWLTVTCPNLTANNIKKDVVLNGWGGGASLVGTGPKYSIGDLVPKASVEAPSVFSVTLANAKQLVGNGVQFICSIGAGVNRISEVTGAVLASNLVDTLYSAFTLSVNASYVFLVTGGLYSYGSYYSRLNITTLATGFSTSISGSTQNAETAQLGGGIDNAGNMWVNHTGDSDYYPAKFVKYNVSGTYLLNVANGYSGGDVDKVTGDLYFTKPGFVKINTSGVQQYQLEATKQFHDIYAQDTDVYCHNISDNIFQRRRKSDGAVLASVASATRGKVMAHDANYIYMVGAQANTYTCEVIVRNKTTLAVVAVLGPLDASNGVDGIALTTDHVVVSANGKLIKYRKDGQYKIVA